MWISPIPPLGFVVWQPILGLNNVKIRKMAEFVNFALPLGNLPPIRG